LSDQETLILEVASVEEARSIAAVTWSLNPEDLIVKVIEEEKSFFGFLGRKLTVEVKPVAPLGLLKGKKALSEILGYMELDVETTEQESNTLNLSGEDAGIIIGKYGETIKSLEYLLNLILRGMDLSSKVRLDSDGYRDRRIASLQRLALSAARKALKRDKPTYLEPMTSWERRVIHMTLKERNDVETRSVGEEPTRKVLVCPSVGRSKRNR